MSSWCQYYENAVRILKKWIFTGSEVDPFLFVVKSSNGITLIALYVDNNLMIGDKAAIDEAIQ